MFSLGALLASGMSAQQNPTTQARTILVNNNLVQIDRGRSDQVEPGDLVWFRPFGSAPVRGIVQSTEERTAWVLVQAIDARIGVGIPVDLASKPSTGGRKERDDHLRNPNSPLPVLPPEWEGPKTPFDPSLPLLAEVQSPIEERPQIWRGQSYFVFDTIREQKLNPSTSIFARAGAGLEGENPFHHGGNLQFEFDIDYRDFQRSQDPRDQETELRLERLSYSHGGTRENPIHWQAGRFLQTAVPEFGVLDGVEGEYRLSTGARIGATAGYLPEPSQRYKSGDDFQLAATYQDHAGENHQWQWAAGFQKSWHQGKPDRDLGILRASYFSNQVFSWTNSIWVDFYTSADTAKSNGPAISIWSSDLRWNLPRHGYSLGFRHWELPQLSRFQGDTLLVQDLLAAGTTRVDGGAWVRIGKTIRLNGRLNAWRAGERNGTGGDLGGEWASLLGPNSRTWVGLYSNEGNDNQAFGLRAGQSLRFGQTLLSLFWDAARYRPLDGEGSLTQQDIRLSFDYWSSSQWSVSTEIGQRFGNEQKSYSLNLFLQRRF